MAGRPVFKCFRDFEDDDRFERIEIMDKYRYVDHKTMEFLVEGTWWSYDLVEVRTNLKNQETTYVLGVQLGCRDDD